MTEFIDRDRLPLHVAMNEADALRRLIRDGKTEDYESAFALRDKLWTKRIYESWMRTFSDAPTQNAETTTPEEHYQVEDGYRWVLVDSKYIPADEEWQPLDLSSCEPTETPWPGDFCYVDMHTDCKNPDCQIPEPQLAYVWMVDEEQGYANVMLVSDDVSKATTGDVILNPDETRIPFDVAVEQACGPVFFDQLSQPVGYTDQRVVDAFLEGTITGKPDFPFEKMGTPITCEEDPRNEYISRRLETIKKLYCYCLSKMLYEDDLAAEEAFNEQESFDELPDDSEYSNEFDDDDKGFDEYEHEEDISDEGYETDNRSYMGY